MTSAESFNERHVVFDIDGTLVDTRGLVFESYALAGIDMPETAWGKPWRTWLIEMTGGDEGAAEEIHAIKTDIYIDMLTSSPPPVLPPTGVAQHLVSEGLATVGFITGASEQAADLILTCLDFNPKTHLLGYSMTAEQKVRSLATLGPNVVYIDDDAATVALIRDKLDVHAIEYYGQDIDEMMEVVWTR